jgi:hypothetical protein
MEETYALIESDYENSYTLSVHEPKNLPIKECLL